MRDIILIFLIFSFFTPIICSTKQKEQEIQEITLDQVLKDLGLTKEKKEAILKTFKSHQALTLPESKKLIFDYWGYNKLHLYKKIVFRMMCQKWQSCPADKAFHFAQEHNKPHLKVTYKPNCWFNAGSISFDLTNPEFITTKIPSVYGIYAGMEIGPEHYYDEQTINSPDNLFHVKVRKEFLPEENNKVGWLTLPQRGSGLLTIRVFIDIRNIFASIFGIPEELQKTIDSQRASGTLRLKNNMATLFHQLPENIQHSILKQFTDYHVSLD